jgi:hypothetical protein
MLSTIIRAVDLHEHMQKNSDAAWADILAYKEGPEQREEGQE